MQSAHCTVLHIYSVAGPCAKIFIQVALPSPSGASTECSFLLCDRGPNLNFAVPQASAINYLTREKIKLKKQSNSVPKAQGAQWRLAGLRPACGIGRDIVISRDHLSNLSQPTTSTRTLSLFHAWLPLHQPACVAPEWIRTPGAPPRWRLPGSLGNF